MELGKKLPGQRSGVGVVVKFIVFVLYPFVVIIKISTSTSTSTSTPVEAFKYAIFYDVREIQPIETTVLQSVHYNLYEYCKNSMKKTAQ